MRLLLLLSFIQFAVVSYGQTEFLTYADSADFDYVSYELLEKHGLTVCKDYERIEDSLVLRRKTEYNFEDSSLLITNYVKKKWGKPTMYEEPMYDKAGVLFINTELDTLENYIHDEYGRLTQSTRITNPNQNKIETYYNYLDTTNYLTFIMEVHTNLNRFVTHTTITNYEYGVSPCSNGTFCYVRWKYVSDRSTLKNDGMKLVEIVYINKYGLLMSKESYKDSVAHYYHYEYE